MKIKSLLFVLVLLCSTSAFAAKGVVIPESDIFRVNAFICGKVNEVLFSGTVLKNGRFYSYQKQLAALTAAIRNASGVAKTKLQKKKRNLKAKKIEADPTCLALQNNTALPNATTYDSSMSFSSMNVETIDTILTGYCPPDLEFGSVWGDFIYTHDSAICAAAVHAGLITQAAGGNVITKLIAGRESYSSVDRNGVLSRSWGAWSYSYVFLGLNNFEEVLS